MKRRAALWALLVICVFFLCWTLVLLFQALQKIDFRLSSSFSAPAIAVVLLSLTLLLIGVVINEAIYQLRRETLRNGFIATRIAWLVGLVASNASAMSVAATSSPTIATPISTSVSPIAAVSVLAHIERRRREQIRTRSEPGPLTDTEMEQLREIRKAAARINHPSVLNLPIPNDHTCHELLRAVDRVAPSTILKPDCTIEAKWIVEVKVFGYPMVVSNNGAVAEFRKKRALELITWLSLNRNRSRRSAARTAMWDIDISDSAFATVVSDMRRALRDLDATHDLNEWAPTTYSDDLPLSPLVVTDADCLRIAHRRFSNSNGRDCAELVRVLKGIRDVPFAGTTYSWADLDGTTTRLIISAVEVCSDVARVACEQHNKELLSIAVSAGLRVLPGCEELLEIQDQYLALSYNRRVKSDFHRNA
jgi:hypothetical protein